MTVPTLSIANQVYNNASTFFIVGNGPSLKNFDFSHLKGRDWLGMNAAYRHWESTGIYPPYYACLDLIVGLSHIDSIINMVSRADSLSMKFFLLRDNVISRSDILQESPLIINYDHFFEKMPDRILDVVTTGSHSAFWAHKMGYEQIILLGIDANYVEFIPGAQSVDTDAHRNMLRICNDGTSENYFFDGYQKAGDTYTVPNPEPNLHKAAWKRVVYFLKRTSPEVRFYNGSDRSKLDCVDFISITDFMESGTSNVEPFLQRIERAANAKGASTGNGAVSEMSGERACCCAAGALKPYTLLHFLHNIMPIRYGNVLIQEGLDNTALSGWASKPLKFEAITPWSGVYLKDRDYVQHQGKISNSGFALVKVIDPLMATSIVNSLNMDFDAVYGIQPLDQEVCLVEYPAQSLFSPDYIVAFARQRFWPRDIERAFCAAVQDGQRGKTFALTFGLIKRRLVFYMKTLKTKFGI